MEHVAVDVPVPQPCGAGFLPSAPLEADRGAHRHQVTQTSPQERIVVDGTMPQAVEKIDVVIDVPVPQILKEQILEVVKCLGTYRGADHGRPCATDRGGNC